MKKIKFEIVMEVEDDFAAIEAKRWNSHHGDYLLDLDSPPEIKRICDCRVTVITPEIENTKFENPMYNKGYDDGFADAMNEMKND